MAGAAVFNHFCIGGSITLDEGEVFVGGDREAYGANAGIEVEDVGSGDVLPDFLEGEFVNGKIDLEEAIGGVRVRAT